MECRRGWALGVLLVVSSCAGPKKEKTDSTTSVRAAAACGDGKKLRVHFYNVAQALAVLVDLPDGRHLLVDTADERNRPGCGAPCAEANAHLLDALTKDVGFEPIEMVWITHQHSDHVGGAPGRFIESFEGTSCKNHVGTWHKVPASARVWATEVDGDVVLETTGDGTFSQAGPNS